MREFFDEFVPQNDSFAFSVLATGKYAQTLLSANSELEILLVYKNLKGYNIKNFLKYFLYALIGKTIFGSYLIKIFLKMMKTLFLGMNLNVRVLILP